MDKLKKFAKEISVFGIVIVIVGALLIYKQFNMNDYTIISADKAVSMIQADKDFIVVFGTTKTTTTSSSTTEEQNNDPANLTAEQATYVKEYIKKHRQKVYYVNADKIEDLATYMKDNFNSDSTLPQTFFINKGEITSNKSGAIKYVEFSKLVTEWKEAK